jgi:uncharacterized protein YbjT (DUF2867 family)
MKILLFGASGMIGQGVLREALADPGVEKILAIVRSPIERSAPKLEVLVHADFLDFSSLEARFAECDACLWCLGVSASGMSEAEYRRVTQETTLAAANVLARARPDAAFLFVSGAGTNDKGGGAMWARVKGDTENALRKLPFRTAVMFRPGYIHPANGEVSRTPLYRIAYGATGWMFPLIRRLGPGVATTTEHVGRAMLKVARDGSPEPILDNTAINRLGAGPGAEA